MALGPNELDNEQCSPEIIAEWEQQIDAHLRRSHIGSSGEVWIRVETPKSKRLQQELTALYRKAGWREAKWEDDQREGSYLRLVR